MVLELLSPARWRILSPNSREKQAELSAETEILMRRFPEVDDKTLRRFLMGNGMKADKAMLAYEAHMKWREESLPVARESIVDELKKGRFYFHGHDKQGRPVAYYSLAMHDPRNRNLEDIFRMMTYQIEQALESLPPDVPGFTVVWDTRKTGPKNTDNEFLREFLAFFQAQYPEVLSQMLIGPVGLLQRSMWNLACRFLDERRVARVKLLPRIEDLVEYIDGGQLLATHGGITEGKLTIAHGSEGPPIVPEC